MSEQVYVKKFEDMTLGQLREVAKHMNIAIPAGSDKDSIVQLLNNRKSQRSVAEVALKGSEPAPGYCRIRIDENPNSNKNIPVYVFDNGLEYTVPRGIEVDVPRRIMQTIRNSIVRRVKQEEGDDGKPKTTYINVPQYPFQLIASTPGPDLKSKREIAAERLIGPRRAYREVFGKWPRRQELNRAIESGIVVLHKGESVPESNMMLEGDK